MSRQQIPKQTQACHLFAEQIEAMRLLSIIVLILPVLLIASGWMSEESSSEGRHTPTLIVSKADSNREKVVASLTPLSFLVGDWKGVAQPKRGSNSGAWSEKAHAAWHFDDTIPCVLLSLEPGKKSTCIFLATTSETSRPIIELRQPDQTPIALEMTEPANPPASESGTPSSNSPQDHWVFESTPEPGKPRHRFTVRKINEIRMTMLFEESPSPEAAFRRQYEIGMTRAGERLANGNTGERQCIVTGGLGTISVQHAGKTYYVCCEGCKQAFDSDPDGTLIAYRERLNKKTNEHRQPCP